MFTLVWYLPKTTSLPELAEGFQSAELANTKNNHLQRWSTRNLIFVSHLLLLLLTPHSEDPRLTSQGESLGERGSVPHWFGIYLKPPRFLNLQQGFKAPKSKTIFRFNPKAFAFFQITRNAL